MSRFDHAPKRGVVAFFVHHPNAANLLMIILLIAGLFSLSRMNSQFFPTIATDTIQVSITWSGASAEDVEANILEIVEPKIRFIDGVDTVQSYAREGAASISLEFKPGADMQLALRDVESAIDTISTLPEQAEDPKVSYREFRDDVARLILSGPFDESSLREFAKTLRDDLIDKGVDTVDFTGLRDEEFYVGLSDYDLRRLGLTIKDVADQVASNSRDLPSGKVQDGIEKQVRTLAAEESPERLSNIEIKSQTDGSSVNLGDISQIQRRLDPDQVRGLMRGQSAIQLVVRRAPSEDSLKASAIVDEYLSTARDIFPPTLIITQYDARAEALVERILLLVKNAVSGLVLVLLILALFLNMRTALWVTAGIPVAMLAACVVLLALGQTINMMSLFAFIMMLGIIVDDAIVVGEEATTRFQAGEPGPIAAEGGGARMLMPVTAASLTTIAAFSPILLIGGVIGQIMGVLPLVVISVLLASLIECFFILPGHLAHSMTPSHHRGWNVKRVIVTGLVLVAPLVLFYSMEKELAAKFGGYTQSTWSWLHTFLDKGPMVPLIAFVSFAFLLATTIELFLVRRTAKQNKHENHGRPKESAFRRAFDKGFAAFRDGPFRSLVTISYTWRYTTIALCIASMAVVYGGLAGGRVGFVFFPSAESETITISMVFNVGILEQDAVKIVKQVDDAVYDTERKLGKGEKLVVASFITLGSSGQTTADNVASLRLRLTSSEQRSVRTNVFQNALRRNMPQIAGLKRASIRGQRGGPPGADLDIRLINAPPETLKQASLDLQERLSSYPGVSELNDNMPYGKPELVLELKPRGRSLGFSAQSIGEQVRDLVDGRTARKLAILDDEVDVLIKQDARNDVDSLRSIWLKSTSGAYVPLTEVVTLRDRQGFSSIQRFDGKTTISVTGDVDSEVVTVTELVAALDKNLMPEIAAKHGVDYNFSGRNEERMEAFADLRLGVMIALAAIYIILAWVFASYSRPLAIMVIIPFGIVGAVLGHYLLGFQLTILSLIGLLGLAGILVNDSIILVSRLDERLAFGETLKDAAIGASCDRLRAVLLTSLTTVSGLTPLLFEASLQAQFLKPMAITIVFGLAVATLFVLFLVPSLFGVGSDLCKATRWLLNGNVRSSQV
ncbi:efflux RND transporter permease subunit [Cohaesibacter celericrescens]|uniref:AcrB/AcrD/AcrF family protein n=1 Tax=Cohaesibacter celericrescens TaxID=2067669 RepID=A0A2N5XN62_9HYPH|nr:efflux RND transporter permease subunit [Cohaesibacter celericrescens]PLW75858.1 AcrB/AcrD/AcrF family protein [Cohaesibacter celericrescens]